MTSLPVLALRTCLLRVCQSFQGEENVGTRTTILPKERFGIFSPFAQMLRLKDFVPFGYCNLSTRTTRPFAESTGSGMLIALFNSEDSEGTSVRAKLLSDERLTSLLSTPM